MHRNADAGLFDYVVVADIADFFPRLYSHPIENALRDCTRTPSEQAKVLIKLFAQWNFTISYGLPVGPSASRLLSELAITDVDEALLSEGQTFCRYSDDYRLFCANEREAHERLALLANTLFENHGLTLQQHKTRIVKIEGFKQVYLASEDAAEKSSLSSRFYSILDELGIYDPYKYIEYDDLDPDIQDKINALNLKEVLEEQVAKETPDTAMTGFILRRLAQLDREDCVEVVLDNIKGLYPVFKDAMRYLRGVRCLTEESRHSIGRRLLNLIDDSIVGHLEYHRCWIFNTFTESRDWNNEEQFVSLHSSYTDEFSERELILALGRSRAQHWFKARKRNVFNLGPWERRAFLAAASCLPGDEATHWYRSIQSRLDELEKSVVTWAKANRF